MSEKHMKKKKLIVNEEKLKIMIFKEAEERSIKEKWKWCIIQVPVSKKYCDNKPKKNLTKGRKAKTREKRQKNTAKMVKEGMNRSGKRKKQKGRGECEKCGYIQARKEGKYKEYIYIMENEGMKETDNGKEPDE